MTPTPNRPDTSSRPEPAPDFETIMAMSDEQFKAFAGENPLLGTQPIKEEFDSAVEESGVL